MTNRQAAIKIISKLHSNGFEALLAGGCVRDMLLKRFANDYDVATSASPGQIIKLFKRTLKIGAKFGVVMVLLRNQKVEVATFRTESDYTDGRRPGSVEFTNAAEDACRRDFTINGMFYDPIEKKVIDYVNGQADLRSRIIRTIGKPTERFGEDYLRMLRAIRFSTQLGFAIEPKTFSAICANPKNIAKISGERIRMELEGILVGPNRAAGAALLIKSGLTEAIFSGFTGREMNFAVKVLAELRKKIDFALALAGFFAGCEDEFAFEKCKVLKLSRSKIKHIKFLLTNRGRLLADEMSLAELKMMLAEPYFGDLYELQKAIQKAEQKSISALINLRKRIKSLGDVELKPKPLLNGHQLMQLGAVRGASLGQLAEEMYIAQLEGKLKTVVQARRWARRWLQERKKAKEG